MKKPIIRLPQNVDDLRREKLEAEERVRVIAKQESGLKQEYSMRSTELLDKIRKLNMEVKKARTELSKFQRENRSSRRKLSEERNRLLKDLKSLKSRYSSLISRTRKKVSENPGDAFRLMEKQQ